jgi:hypothetical protein
MKVLVPVKRVVDYNVKVRVKADGSGVETAKRQDGDEPVLTRSPSRRPLRLKEKGVATEVIVDLRRADRRRQETDPHRARHGGRPRHPRRSMTAVLEPLGVAKLLKAIVAKEDPALVILGKQAIDDDMNADRPDAGRAARLAARATFASKIVKDGDSADGDARGRWRARDASRCQAAGDRHHRPAAERAALRVAAQHHEGAQEADRDGEAGRRARRRSRAAPDRAEGRVEPAKRQAERQAWGRSRNWWTVLQATRRR